jgi:hypothetical protein
LHKAGNHAEARKQMDQALGIGIRDAEFYRHAATIALAMKDRSSAKLYEQKAAELAPRSQVASSGRNTSL